MANGETRGKRALPGKRGEGLFALHSLVENHLASLFHVDDAMNGFVAIVRFGGVIPCHGLLARSTAVHLAQAVACGVIGLAGLRHPVIFLESL